MRGPLKNANLLVRFLLELSALAAMAYWGFSVTSGLAQWVLGLGAPLTVAVVWGLFVSPKHKVELASPARFAIELTVFAAAALALAAADQPVLAVALAVIELISGTMNYVSAGLS